MFRELRYGTTATYILIGLNTIIFLIALTFNLSFSPTEGALANFLGASNLNALYGGEAWRFVTANFLHIDVLHFVFNIFALYYYGKFIENYYSSSKIFIIYLISGIAGMVLATSIDRAIILGASASIYGFLGVIIGSALRPNTYSPGLPITLRDILPATLIWLFIGRLIPGISFWGHVGGLIAGIVLGLLIDTENTFNPSDIQDRIIKVIAIISVIIILLSFLFLIMNIFIG